MLRVLRGFAALVLLVAGATPASTATSAAPVPWLTGLNFPTKMAFAPDGRLFFTQKETGSVRVVGADGTLRPDPFATLDVHGGGETGLLGIAFDPLLDREEPWTCLYLSDASTAMNEVVRVRADGDRAGDPQLLGETVPAVNAYHNGGDLLFVADGMLYVSVGEAHEADRAQDPSDPGGKILRLAPEGEPAPGGSIGHANPASTVKHRNSFGLCLDPASGAIWETENGPDRDDEVDLLRPGANHGWPEVTGDDGPGGGEDPVAVLGSTVALTGCAWWDGTLMVGSFDDGVVRTIDPATGDAAVIATLDARLDPAAEQPGPTAPPADTPADRRWLAIGAAIVLAGALLLRVRAGRSLRSSDA